MVHSVQPVSRLESDQGWRPPVIQLPDRPAAPIETMQADSKLMRLRACNCLAAQALVPLATCLGPRVAGAFGILMYHRVVASPAGVVTPTWNVTPQRFRHNFPGC